MPGWFTGMLLVALAAVVLVMVLPAFEPIGGGSGGIAVYYGVMTIAFAVTAFAMLTFRSLKVVVSEGQVRFGFGLLRKSIRFEQIKAIEAKRYRWLIYGGWGVRLSFSGRRAWSVPGVPAGAELTVEEGRRVRRYFVSSRFPERLLEAMQYR